MKEFIVYCLLFIVYYRHEYPQWPDKGEDHEGMKGVYCFMVFGICSLFLIYFYETRCCKGEGFSVSIRSYVPNVSTKTHDMLT